MKKRTVLTTALVAVPLGGLIGLLLLVVVMPKLIVTLFDQLKEEGPWELQFPSEAPADVLSEARLLEGRRAVHGVGRWFEQGPAVLKGEEGKCRALGPDLKVIGELALPYRCHEVINLCEDAPMIVALVAESAAPFGQTAVGLSDQGVERWRFSPSDSVSLEVAAPLYDEGGLYGVAFGPGGDEGIVAVDLDGRRLWEVPKEYVLYTLSTHPSLPGKLLALGGHWSVFDHDREGVRTPVFLGRRAVRRPPWTGGYEYTHDGVIFPEAGGSTGVIVVGISMRDVPHVSRCDEHGERRWQADLSEQAEGVVLLGRRRGKFLFAAALRDTAIVVFDEDGTLLDQARVPGDESVGGYHVFALSGGEIGPGRGAITIDTSLGNYLFEVDLAG